jgi:hypothetical protein
MANESRGRSRVASESLSLTTADNSSPSYSQLRSAGSITITPSLSQDIIVRNSRRKEHKEVFGRSFPRVTPISAKANSLVTYQMEMKEDHFVCTLTE